MDNRPDVIEDPQAKSGLTAGPHNNPPRSAGIEDRYQPPASTDTQSTNAWQSLQQIVSRYPLRVALSVAGLGLAVALLATRRARAR